MSECFPSEMADDVDDSLTALISDFDVSTVLIFSSRKVNYEFILAYPVWFQRWISELFISLVEGNLPRLFCLYCKYIPWLVRVKAKLCKVFVLLTLYTLYMNLIIFLHWSETFLSNLKTFPNFHPDVWGSMRYKEVNGMTLEKLCVVTTQGWLVLR